MEFLHPLGEEENTNSGEDMVVYLFGKKRDSKLGGSLGSVILASERSFLADFKILEKWPLGGGRRGFPEPL